MLRNDETNGPMLRVNENLGYRPIGSTLTWSRPRARPLALANAPERTLTIDRYAGSPRCLTPSRRSAWCLRSPGVRHRWTRLRVLGMSPEESNG